MIHDDLVKWLREHPSTWQGWPTYTFADDREEQDKLRERLRKHGCPVLEPLRVSSAIAQIRGEQRSRYNRSVKGAL
jgi:hypothetical protein